MMGSSNMGRRVGREPIKIHKETIMRESLKRMKGMDMVSSTSAKENMKDCLKRASLMARANYIFPMATAMMANFSITKGMGMEC